MCSSGLGGTAPADTSRCPHARRKQEEWSRALLQLAELSGDTTFVTEFAMRPGAVGLVLGVLLAAKGHRLRSREKVWTLRYLTRSS